MLGQIVPALVWRDTGKLSSMEPFIPSYDNIWPIPSLTVFLKLFILASLRNELYFTVVTAVFAIFFFWISLYELKFSMRPDCLVNSFSPIVKYTVFFCFFNWCIVYCNIVLVSGVQRYIHVYIYIHTHTYIYSDYFPL